MTLIKSFEKNLEHHLIRMKSSDHELQCRQAWAIHDVNQA